MIAQILGPVLMVLERNKYWLSLLALLLTVWNLIMSPRPITASINSFF
jgi:hypothetical protein